MKQCFRFQLQLLVCMLLISLAGYSQNNASSSSTPNPMPKLQSTGNAEVDRVNHAKAVEAWKEKESKRVEQLRSNSVDSKNTSAKSNVVKTKSNSGAEKNSNVSNSKDARVREILPWMKKTTKMQKQIGLMQIQLHTINIWQIIQKVLVS
jgi:hypothetical protein